jgi:2-methylcitrate dehydratase PrpD
MISTTTTPSPRWPPRGVVFNAALAVGDPYDMDSRKVLLAHIAGVETMMRLGLVVNPDHYNSGWHATASLGVFGATVAAGLLMGLNDEELEHALGIAASMATGLKVNFGSDTKSLQVGAGNGVTAAQLAAKGIRAATGPLFGTAGFLATAGSKRDPRPIIEAFGEPYGLGVPGAQHQDLSVLLLLP